MINSIVAVAVAVVVVVVVGGGGGVVVAAAAAAAATRNSIGCGDEAVGRWIGQLNHVNCRRRRSHLICILIIDNVNNGFNGIGCVTMSWYLDHIQSFEIGHGPVQRAAGLLQLLDLLQEDVRARLAP